MSTSSSTQELKLKLTIKDKRAIEIIKKIPAKRRDETIEKYIVIGEMVVSHASISTTKETVDEFFSPLKSDIDMIRTQLGRIVPSVTIPARKAKINQEEIFNSLKAHFMDDIFEDVSRIGKYADILATTSDTKIPVLIELKDYNDTVPSNETKKFWRDLERRGTKYGIFVSMRSDISQCSSCISVKTELSRTAIFVNNSELNWSGHLFAFYVIKKIAELESLKRRELKGEDIEKVISKINNHAIELQKNIESIDRIQTMADSLRTTCKNRLDELYNFADSLKRVLTDKTNEIFEDLKKVDV